MNKLIIIPFLIASLFSQSQVPGYMGKKVAFGLDFSYSVTGHMLTMNNELSNQSIVKPRLSVLASISRKAALYLDFTNSSNTFIRGHEFNLPESDNNDQLYNTETIYVDYTSSSTHIGLGAKFYGGVSPQGSYFDIGLMFNNLNSYKYSNPLTNQVHEYSLEKSGLKSFLTNIKFGWGKTRAITDYLLLDYSAAYFLSLTWDGAEYFGIYRELSDTPILDNTFSVNSFNFHIGLKYML